MSAQEILTSVTLLAFVTCPASPLVGDLRAASRTAWISWAAVTVAVLVAMLVLR